MRMSVVLKVSPLTRTAMDAATKIEAAAATADPTAKISMTGATAEMIDLRDITQIDFHRIAICALVAILLVVWAVLRDLPVAIFILAATALSYLTTLGLTCWVFQLLGDHGLEWKVQMLLFIVLIAVGQDYSIFFAVRLAQEARTLPCKQATEKALIFTGPVISSCGLIMAATPGQCHGRRRSTAAAIRLRLRLRHVSRHIHRPPPAAAVDDFIKRPHAAARRRWSHHPER